ncbi:MAG TPA: glycosyltransferase family 2 protein [Candidatus Sumerlaeota bacterium]|nr:glycosyltransferase family 2 protein [Candidatus Sumerlaeota bacterium]
MKLSLIIPIYNEVELLSTVLERVRAAIPFEHELILVDDHSTDGTDKILHGEESKPDTIVVWHEKNKGKGAAIRSGLAHATGDIIIVQDADMEYDPRDIPKVIQPILDGKTRVAYGSRFMGEVRNMRLPNRVANHLLAWLVSILYFSRVTDEATAYKAFTRDVIKSIKLDCNRFEFCPEVTAKVLRRGEKIIETPISFNARTFEEGKKIGWQDFIVAVWTLVKYRFVK